MIYVVLSGCVGNLPQVRSFLVNYGQAAVCTPCDIAFPKDGIAAEADPNCETRRQAFEEEVTRYVDFYLQHMRLEETEVLPAAEKHLTDADWHALNAAFATNLDPLNTRIPRDPQFDRLFTQIVMRAPAPVGLGEG
jgi:hypothetical protein